MGNYPYESDYMTHGDGKPMVAWPMRAACKHLADASLANASDATLLAAVREFVAVYYNRTGVDAACFFNGAAADAAPSGGGHARARRLHVRRARVGVARTRRERDGVDDDGVCAGTWDWQYCTEMVQPFASGLGEDMYWPPAPWNVSETARGCAAEWDVQTRPTWASVGFPGSRLDKARFSNLVFTNGALDPWSGGGVLANVSDSVRAYVLPNGAHHLDLMWSHPDDPPDAIDARRFIAENIGRWVAEKRNANGREL